MGDWVILGVEVADSVSLGRKVQLGRGVLVGVEEGTGVRVESRVAVLTWVGVDGVEVEVGRRTADDTSVISITMAIISRINNPKELRPWLASAMF